MTKRTRVKPTRMWAKVEGSGFPAVVDWDKQVCEDALDFPDDVIRQVVVMSSSDYLALKRDAKGKVKR